MKTFQTMMFVVLLTALSACTPAPTHLLSFPLESVTVPQGGSIKLTMSITKVDPAAGAAQITLLDSDPELTVTPSYVVVAGDRLEVSIAVSKTAKIGDHGFGFEPNPHGYHSEAFVRVNVTAPQ